MIPVLYRYHIAQRSPVKIAEISWNSSTLLQYFIITLASNSLNNSRTHFSDDGTPPDLKYMWLDSDIRSRVSCKLTKGEVCARWTYTYNNECKYQYYVNILKCIRLNLKISKNICLQPSPKRINCLKMSL